MTYYDETRGGDLERECRDMGRAEFRDFLEGLSEAQKDDLELGLRRALADKQARDADLEPWTPPRRPLTRTSSSFERAMAEIHERLGDEPEEEID